MEYQQLPEFVRNDSFVIEYANQLKKLINECPRYEDEAQRYKSAFKMIVAIATDTSRWDVYRGNPACRAAGKKFGCKTSKEFRETVRELWRNGWLQDESKKLTLVA